MVFDVCVYINRDREICFYKKACISYLICNYIFLCIIPHIKNVTRKKKKIFFIYVELTNRKYSFPKL